MIFRAEAARFSVITFAIEHTSPRKEISECPLISCYLGTTYGKGRQSTSFHPSLSVIASSSLKCLGGLHCWDVRRQSSFTSALIRTQRNELKETHYKDDYQGLSDEFIQKSHGNVPVSQTMLLIQIVYSTSVLSKLVAHGRTFPGTG